MSSNRMVKQTPLDGKLSKMIPDDRKGYNIMYSIGDNIRPIDRLGHSYKVVARYYCQSDNSQSTWLLHASDILPVFDYCLVNCDTGLLEHLIITHADCDGIIPAESQVNHVVLDDCLMPLKLVVCHPKTVKANYPFWYDLIIGGWTGETLVTLKDGILYICSDTSIHNHN